MKSTTKKKSIKQKIKEKSNTPEWLLKPYTIPEVPKDDRLEKLMKALGITPVTPTDTPEQAMDKLPSFIRKHMSGQEDYKAPFTIKIFEKHFYPEGSEERKESILDIAPIPKNLKNLIDKRKKK